MRLGLYDLVNQNAPLDAATISTIQSQVYKNGSTEFLFTQEIRALDHMYRCIHRNVLYEEIRHQDRTIFQWKYWAKGLQMLVTL